MLKVMLVDDESFILDGLRVLIDWEKEGFEICKMAGDGIQALEYLKNHKVDLIISDIKMPNINGLDLLEQVRKEDIFSGYFVLLSGFADFNYAQEAIKKGCNEYILKPVDKDELLAILEKVSVLNAETKMASNRVQKLEKAYLKEHILGILRGRYEEESIEYIKKNMFLQGELRYLEAGVDRDDYDDEPFDKDKIEEQKELYKYCMEFLKEFDRHCILDNYSDVDIYGIGIIYADNMALKLELGEKEYFEKLQKYLNMRMGKNVVLYIGKKVSNVSQLSRSYGNVYILRSFRGFRNKKNIYYYEEEVNISSKGAILCGESLEFLLGAIKENHREHILSGIDMFFDEIAGVEISNEIMSLNINYLLYKLIYFATDLDPEINQEEVLSQISTGSLREGIQRGGKEHLVRFSLEYAEYLSQLRKKTSNSILKNIEAEIRNHYNEGITLKELSKKYFINRAYLGQIFRKKYNQSFKDYLNNFRIEKAADLLIKTDKKIIDIAEEVGYKDVDYFVNRFIISKGCSPAKFRRQ